MFRSGLRPLEILARNFYGSVRVVGENSGLSQFLRHLDPISDSFFVDSEDIESGGNPLRTYLFVDLRLVFLLEALDILLREIDATVVEHLEIGLEDTGRHLVVEWLADEMLVLQHSDDTQSEVAVLSLGTGRRRCE